MINLSCLAFPATEMATPIMRKSDIFLIIEGVANWVTGGQTEKSQKIG